MSLPVVKPVMSAQPLHDEMAHLCISASACAITVLFYKILSVCYWMQAESQLQSIRQDTGTLEAASIRLRREAQAQPGTDMELALLYMSSLQVPVC